VGLRINEEKTKYLKCSKKDTNEEDLNCPNLFIEQVNHYKYLGSIINDNSIEEEIKDRIVLGTKAYYANLQFFKSKLVTKNSKLKLYRSVIRQIVTYASETWVLKKIFNPETVRIRKENPTENIWTHKRNPVMENQN
jgi:hypothetical protein